MKPYPATTKRKALSPLADGLMHQQVANRINVGRTTITTWAMKLPKDALRGIERPKAGRPRKLTDSDACNVSLNMRHGITRNAVWATEALNKENKNPVSAQTVRRASQRVGDKAKKMKKRPRLSRANKITRKGFAATYAGWAEDDWSRVV
ncbi:hypothetical protein BG015_011535 [Linnemannia schmuckeri]|uniref:Transposase Tc1-like domain-containing protein n=1 Tax=Linnemannia schmuckeri TaxID=64567 RepID=A0A9P5S7D8_9FUNG|nr:hypothetical protein BG015_011535 [Linnemannia schmuckeri]